MLYWQIFDLLGTLHFTWRFRWCASSNFQINYEIDRRGLKLNTDVNRLSTGKRCTIEFVSDEGKLKLVATGFNISVDFSYLSEIDNVLWGVILLWVIVIDNKYNNKSIKICIAEKEVLNYLNKLEH